MFNEHIILKYCVPTSVMKGFVFYGRKFSDNVISQTLFPLMRHLNKKFGDKWANSLKVMNLASLYRIILISTIMIEKCSICK